MKSTKLILLSPLILLLVTINCKPEDSQNPIDYPKSLIIASGAMNVRFTKLDGMDQVRYKVLANYPASEIIQQIDSKLKNNDWQFLEKDFLKIVIL